MGKKPNILVIFGDDIGYWNLSCYNDGMMGYKTPNIDRIAKDGLRFTDFYAEQSCTAGRAAFITGQYPVRTGLTKVGIPGARVGLQDEDATIAEVLKEHGYACGQFGKNHLGDRNEFLPTVHGFDEFFGNLYHLNAEEEPENPDYPKDPEFRKRYGPRGVLHCKATDKDDPTEMERWGRVGKQTIEDTGPLTKKRMETFDGEVLDKATDFIKRKNKEKKPWFAWFNTTRMHFMTHVSQEKQTGKGFYADGMVEHDEHVGSLLDLLEELKADKNTIVLYTTDNGPHYNAWPDGAITPFKSEKNTNWEGAFRVPCVIRWPGQFPAGEVKNGIVAQNDWFPTFLAAIGDETIAEKLKAGYQANDKTFKVHLDGYNVLPYLKGEEEESPRPGFFYFNDDGQLVAIRHGDWKAVYLEQLAHQFGVWMQPFNKLRLPKLFNLRRDPFEKADTDSNNYYDWLIRRAFLIVAGQALALKALETFKNYPPRQKPAAFNLDEIKNMLLESRGEGGRADGSPDDFSTKPSGRGEGSQTQPEARH